MRLTAASQQAAFQYDLAIKTYLDLYETTKKAQKLGIKPPDPLPGACEHNGGCRKSECGL